MWKRIVVISAGPAVNIVLAFLILWGLYSLSTLTSRSRSSTSSTPGSPAASVLKPGDRILSVDGTPGFTPGLRPEDAPERVDDAHGRDRHAHLRGHAAVGCRATEPVRFEVLRGAHGCAWRSRRATPCCRRPRATPSRQAAGADARRPAVRPPAGRLRRAEAARYAARRCGRSRRRRSTRSSSSFYDKEARDQVSGVVGSYEATRQSFEFDTKQAIYVLALISLSLGIINLFPFLPLDGGHIFWALAEKVRGRPIPFRIMERAGIVGFMLVLFLFYIGLSNDIGRLSSGEGFGVR